MWNHLGIESDEAVVLSAVYETAPNTPILMAASLLVGPAGIASTGWPGWRLAEGFKPQPAGPALEVPATFTVELGSAIAGRITMSQPAAYDWTRSVLEQGICPGVGGLPEARAFLAPARAPIKVSTHSQTDAGDPPSGWLLALVDGADAHRVHLLQGELEQAGCRWHDLHVDALVTGAMLRQRAESLHARGAS